MKHKKLTRVLSMFLAVLMVLGSVPLVTDFAENTKASGTTYTDGTGSTNSGGSSNISGGYNVRYDDNNLTDQQGFRYTYIQYDADGNPTVKGSLDVFYSNVSTDLKTYNNYLKVTDTSGNVYANIDKYTSKTLYLGTGSSIDASVNKISALTATSRPSTKTTTAGGAANKGTYHWCYDTDLSLIMPAYTVSSTSNDIVKEANNKDSINPILNVIQSGLTLEQLSYRDIIEVEPLYSLKIDGTSYTISMQQIALLGCFVLGRWSNGLEYSGGKIDFGNNGGRWAGKG